MTEVVLVAGNVAPLVVETRRDLNVVVEIHETEVVTELVGI